MTLLGVGMDRIEILENTVFYLLGDLERLPTCESCGEKAKSYDELGLVDHTGKCLDCSDSED